MPARSPEVVAVPPEVVAVPPDVPDDPPEPPVIPPSCPVTSGVRETPGSSVGVQVVVVPRASAVRTPGVRVARPSWAGV
ncbi:hypothetical protein [Actinacidiphila glaucinigra]|uniref:hypothetical protein n=1 Tax=Actinacidiphila glaucinigra TaxID=235986 RepID=UPI002E369B79|nr:hypothetical protein [Actinacidiphila glaucinigra]